MKKKSKILLIDDQRMNRIILKKFLLLENYNVEEAESGKEGMEILKKKKIDLILLDIMMPEMNGYEMMREIKENEKLKDIPVIFLTALNATEDKVKGFREGAVDYIQKPFNREELIARVSTHIKLKKVTEEIKKDMLIGSLVHKKILSFKEPKLEKYKIYYKNELLNGLGGDYIDSIKLTNGNVGIIFIDISGHGIAGSLLVSALKFIVNTYLKDISMPSEALYLLNEMVETTFISKEYMLNVVYFILDEKNNKITLSSGAQEDIYIMKKNGLEKIKEKGVILGALTNEEILELENISYKNLEIDLNKDEKIFMYTDGLIENENFNRKDLKEMLENENEIEGELLYQKLSKKMNEIEEKSDDVSFLILEKA